MTIGANELSYTYLHSIIIRTVDIINIAKAFLFLFSNMMKFLPRSHEHERKPDLTYLQ